MLNLVEEGEQYIKKYCIIFLHSDQRRCFGIMWKLNFANSMKSPGFETPELEKTGFTSSVSSSYRLPLIFIKKKKINKIKK